jgi:hypothetical protein
MTPSYWQNCRATRLSSGPPDGLSLEEKKKPCVTRNYGEMPGMPRIRLRCKRLRLSPAALRSLAQSPCILSAGVRPSPNGGWLLASDDATHVPGTGSEERKNRCASLVSTSPPVSPCLQIFSLLR